MGVNGVAILDLEWPPKAHMLKAWLQPGINGRRWHLQEVF